MFLAKPKRMTSPKYLGFIRTKSCLTCNATPVDAHHLESRGSGGSDMTAVPLCRACHVGYHTLGPSRFEDIHGINLWREAAHLLAEFFA